MFYSRAFLARKGPLGTVWCAAHLQYSLKKADYTRTNIPSTVEYIMYPEVPIALRMSGHLLLGVVRIYSKQVDYFFQECNYLELRIRKAFAPANINLPEGATQAPYNSVTLPETFQLDALESYEDQYQERFVDTHLKLPEEITLEDQIPTGREEYVAIFLDEDVGRDLQTEDNGPGLCTTPMEKDSHPSSAEGASGGSEHSPHDTEIGLNERTAQDGFTQEFPETEVLRDASHNVDVPSSPLWANRRDDVLEPDFVLAEQVTKDDTNLSPVVEETLSSGKRSFPSQHPSTSSEDGRANIGSNLLFGHESPALVIRSTPQAPPPEQPRARQRKRKLLIDDTLVLPNKLIKASLKDTSHLKRQRKDAPHSSLGIWRFSKRLKKDAMFFQPLITGQCEDLSKMHEHGFIFARAHISSTEEARDGAQSSSSVGRDDMEIERLRDNEGPTDTSFLQEVLHMPNTVISSPFTSVPSSSRQDDFTPAVTSVGSESADQTGKTMDSGVLPTPDQAASTGHLHSDVETPNTFMEEDVRFETTALSDIPEFDNSVGDLSFLEQDDNTPSASEGTPEVGLSGKQKGTSEFYSLSTRTKAVAQYLKGQSSATPVAKGPTSSSTPVSGPGGLSLGVVLNGKSRKICARMFYESLVLKNFGLLDVNQEEPYGDVTLKPTSKLFKEPLSG